MQFIFISDYAPQSDDLRSANRAAHLAYWTGASTVKLLNGGPLLGADGKPFGSMFMLEAADEAAARSGFEADPYVTAGVAHLKTVTAYRVAIRDGKLAS